jgi:hypothetical protein
MEFTLLFTAITATPPCRLVGIANADAVTFIASVATYLHHATDKLNLSF